MIKEVEERKAMLIYEVQLRKERQRSVSENEIDESSRHVHFYNGYVKLINMVQNNIYAYCTVHKCNSYYIDCK